MFTLILFQFRLVLTCTYSTLCAKNEAIPIESFRRWFKIIFKFITHLYQCKNTTIEFLATVKFIMWHAHVCDGWKMINPGRVFAQNPIPDKRSQFSTLRTFVNKPKVRIFFVSFSFFQPKHSYISHHKLSELRTCTSRCFASEIIFIEVNLFGIIMYAFFNLQKKSWIARAF